MRRNCLGIFILLVTMYQRLPQSSAALWCYCTRCPQDISYCRVNRGYCFKQKISPTFYEYGCWDANGSNLFCNYSTRCCNDRNWCTIDEQIYRMTKIDLLDTEEEENHGNLSCYCNRCGGTRKSCVTDGKCTMDRSRSIEDPDYGCLSKNASDVSCQKDYGNQILNVTCDPAVLCCSGQNWCNYGGALSNRSLDTVVSELRIKTLRLERIGPSIIGEATPTQYNLIVRNGMSGKIRIIHGVLLPTYTVKSFTLENGSFDFKLAINQLYYFNITPIFKGIHLYDLSKKIYLARLYGFTGSWLPNNISLSNVVIDVVTCDSCGGNGQDFKCGNCHKDVESFNNPIWLSNFI